MKKVIALILAVTLGLLLVPSAVTAASGIQVVGKTGDGVWTDNTWQVEIYPGESKSTTISLYNSSSSSLGVEVTIFPESLDNGNLSFELNKATFTMPGRSYTDVTLSVKANGSATPGTYIAELKIKSEVAPVSPPAGRDATPPIISDIQLSPGQVTETTAHIYWITNEPSTSQVEYWTSPSMLSPLDEAYVTEHHVELTDLTPDTTYYYKTMSRDKAGNLAVSDEYIFTTLKEEEEPVEPVEPVEPEPIEPEVVEPEGEEPEEEEPEVVEPEEEEPEVVEPEEEEEPYMPPEKPKPGIPWALIGGVVGGLAAVGGIGYWLWRRRRMGS